MKKIILLILCAALFAAVPVCFTSAAEEPIRVTPMVSIGNHFMIALCSDGTALAWGENQSGVLGNGTTEDSVTPQPVTMPVANQAAVRFSSVCAGYDHVIALATDGTVWTWGSDENGQLGNRTEANTPQSVTNPKQVGGELEGKTVVSVAAGKAFSLALTSEGKVYAWGINQFGVLGNLDQPVSAEYSICYPTRVTALDAPFITAIFAGEQTAGALDSNGQVWLWGNNEKRQAGSIEDGEDGNINVVSVPLQKQASAAYCARSIALGGNHTAVLMNDGKVASLGDQKYGQLGDGVAQDNNDVSYFKYLPDGTAAMKMIAAGNEHSVALGADGKVYVWGHNDSGILGTGSQEDVLKSPVEVTSELWGTPVAVFAGYDNTVVIDDQGLVYAWGSNSSGELGIDTESEPAEAPVRVLASDGNVNLMLGVGSPDQIYHTQITLNAVIPEPTFSVSIPSTVDVGELTQRMASEEDAVKVTAFEVKASNVDNLFGEKQIVVSLSVPNGEFVLKDEEFWLAYSVFASEEGGEALNSGDVFAVFENNRTAKGRIEIDQSQITRRGNYTGSMRFTVSVADKEAEQ